MFVSIFNNHSDRPTTVLAHKRRSILVGKLWLYLIIRGSGIGFRACGHLAPLMRVYNGASILFVIGHCYESISRSDAFLLADKLDSDWVVILQDQYALHYWRLAVAPMEPAPRATACCIAPYSGQPPYISRLSSMEARHSAASHSSRSPIMPWVSAVLIFARIYPRDTVLIRHHC